MTEWQQYRRTGAMADRNVLVLRFIWLSRNIAKRLYEHTHTTVGYDDFASAAAIGLIEAVQRYDPSRGVLFSGFASRRIRGAVYDWLRGSQKERFVRLDDPSEQQDEHEPEPHTSIAHKLWLAHVTRGMTRAEQLIIRLRFCEDLSVSTTAAVIGVDRSRVCQIQRRLFSMLRERLAEVL